MTVSPIQRRSDAFEMRNGFGQVLLGLLSACTKLDGVLAREAVPAPEGEPTDERLLDVLLGLVALRAQISSLVDGVPGPPDPAPQLPVGAPTPWREIAR